MRLMIRHWSVLDLNVFRRLADDAGVRSELQDNHDGTSFVAYDLRSFPDELIVDCSATMRIALEKGVDAVEPLRSKQQSELDRRWREIWALDPSPDLQELVRSFGGYNKITSEAWAEFDRLKEAWHRRHAISKRRA